MIQETSSSTGLQGSKSFGDIGKGRNSAAQVFIVLLGETAIECSKISGDVWKGQGLDGPRSRWIFEGRRTLIFQPKVRIDCTTNVS
jgi:hypothetical protein